MILYKEGYTKKKLVESPILVDNDRYIPDSPSEGWNPSMYFIETWSRRNRYAFCVEGVTLNGTFEVSSVGGYFGSTLSTYGIFFKTEEEAQRFYYMNEDELKEMFLGQYDIENELAIYPRRIEIDMSDPINSEGMTPITLQDC